MDKSKVASGLEVINSGLKHNRNETQRSARRDSEFVIQSNGVITAWRMKKKKSRGIKERSFVLVWSRGREEMNMCGLTRGGRFLVGRGWIRMGRKGKREAKEGGTSLAIRSRELAFVGRW